MIYALVPARGGSKGIKGKNIKNINGRPLIWWVLSEASMSVVDKIFVLTDDEGIRDMVSSFRIDNVWVEYRSPHTATDAATTESVMIEFCERYEFDTLVLLQPTSPLITGDEITRAIKIQEDCDTIVPVIELDKFTWLDDGKSCIPQNYDPKNRPRRQDFTPMLVENGYIYVMDREAFLKERCRLYGNIQPMYFPQYTMFEPDDHDTWKIVETLLARHDYLR